MTTRWEVERAVASSTLEPIARLIVLTLLIKVDNETAVIPPEYSPSYSTLEAATGLSRSMLSKNLDRLEDLGWVKRSKPPKNSRHERTRYALAIGASPEREKRPSRRWKPDSGSSQEPQSSSSQEPFATSTDGGAVLPKNRTSSSSQEPLLVLPENHTPGTSSSSQEHASSRTTTTKSTTRAARRGAPADGSWNAGRLLGDWLEHCTKRPPDRVIGHMSGEIAKLLEEGIDPLDVRRGIALWHAKGKHPSTLPSFVNEAMNATQPQQRLNRPGHDSRRVSTQEELNEWAELAARREAS